MIIAQHGGEDGEEFSHAGDEDDLGALVGVSEAAIEGADGGVVSGGDEGGHVVRDLDFQTFFMPARRLAG